jgi:transcriptional regulator with XRE-family HTH domain
MAELDRASIAARIKKARKEAGLTQPELGDALEPSMHYRTVQTWESVKKPTVPWEHLDQIARITNVTKEWLLHGDEAIDARELADVIRETLVEEFASREVSSEQVASLEAASDRLVDAASRIEAAAALLMQQLRAQDG